MVIIPMTYICRPKINSNYISVSTTTRDSRQPENIELKFSSAKFFSPPSSSPSAAADAALINLCASSFPNNSRHVLDICSSCSSASLAPSLPSFLLPCPGPFLFFATFFFFLIICLGRFRPLNRSSLVSPLPVLQLQPTPLLLLSFYCRCCFRTHNTTRGFVLSPISAAG